MANRAGYNSCSAGIPSLKETDSDSMLGFRGNVSGWHFVTVVSSFLLTKLHSVHTICAADSPGQSQVLASEEHDPT